MCVFVCIYTWTGNVFFSQINEVVRSFACSKNMAVCMKSARYVCEHHKNLRPNPWAKLLGTAWNWQRIQCLSIGGLSWTWDHRGENGSKCNTCHHMSCILFPYWCPTGALLPGIHLVTSSAPWLAALPHGHVARARARKASQARRPWHDGIVMA